MPQTIRSSSTACNNSDTLEVHRRDDAGQRSPTRSARSPTWKKSLVAALKAMLGIYAKVRLVAPKSIARSEGKAVRVIDKRKI